MEGNFQIKDHKFCKGRTSPLAGIPYLRGGEDKIDQFVIWRRSSNCRPDDHTSWLRSANTIGIPNSQLTLWTSFRGNWEYFILWSALFDFKCPYLQLSPKSSYLVLQNTVRNVTFLKPKNKRKIFFRFSEWFPSGPSFTTRLISVYHQRPPLPTILMNNPHGNRRSSSSRNLFSPTSVHKIDIDSMKKFFWKFWKLVWSYCCSTF